MQAITDINAGRERRTKQGWYDEFTSANLIDIVSEILEELQRRQRVGAIK